MTTRRPAARGKAIKWKNADLIALATPTATDLSKARNAWARWVAGPLRDLLNAKSK
jgi:hypothetical protein